PGGARTFVFVYRPGGGGRKVNPRHYKLGNFPSLGTDDARKLARKAAGQVADDKDPAEVRRGRKRSAKATLSTPLGTDGPYELHLKARGLVNIKPALSALRRKLRAHMGSDVAKLTRTDVVMAIDALTKRGKKGAAATATAVNVRLADLVAMPCPKS